MILIFGIFLPMLNAVAIPIRWMFAHYAIATDVQALARSEKLSDAHDQLKKHQDMRNALMRFGGIKVKESRLSLVVVKPDDELNITYPNRIPDGWLPQQNGCVHYLQLATLVEISPLAATEVFGMSITGLNAPVTIRISSRCNWENLGKDVLTNEFYLNE
jgi:hypothetical protein